MPDTPRRALEPVVVTLLVLFILILAGYFRLVGLNWDDYTHLHPDERFLTIVTSSLQTTANPLLYLQTSQSPLNPYNVGQGFYVYGNFPMTVTRYVAELAEWFRGFCSPLSEAMFCRNNLVGYDGVHLVGRALSALVDLVSVLFTFLIGRRLYGTWAGVIGAFLLATAVMPIQQSHFYTMDNWAAALTTLSIYTAVRASENAPQWRWWLLFGIGLGLTVASRINVAPLAIIAGVAGLVWLGRNFYQWRESSHQPTASFWRYLRTDHGIIQLQYVIVGVMLAALVSLAVFRLAQPYAFADREIATSHHIAQRGAEPSLFYTTLYSLIGFNPQWQANMEEIQRLQAPEANFPPALQWVSRPAILFPLSNMLLYGMGLLAGIAAWAGFLWALWRIVRGRPDWLIHAIPVAWVGIYFLFAATRWVKSVRYFLPIYPILFILAGWLFFELWHRTEKHKVGRLLVSVALGATLLTSLLWANAFVEIYRQPLTRVAASEWMYENVPTAVTLLYQTADGTPREQNLPSRGNIIVPGAPLTIPFTPQEAGTLTGVRFNYLSSPDGMPSNATLRVGLGAPFGSGATAEGQINLNVDDRRIPATIPLPPTPLTPDQMGTLWADLGAGGQLLAGTSVITSEHWDDALPQRLHGRDPYSQYFQGLSSGQMSTTHPDSYEKLQQLLGWLDEADYIALSSQRSLWHLPRLPLTYPLMVRYYDALFSGELGFEKVAEFHGDIALGPLHISDTGGTIGWGAPPEIGWPPPPEWAAEEAFSVYDHPPVWIFRKTEAYDPEKVRQLLEEVDLSQVQVMNPLEATNAPNGMMLTREQQQIQQSGGTFSELFNGDGLLSTNSFAAVVVWWLAVILLGWLAFPLAFVALRGLPDRGYALARVLALLLVSYFGWLMASLKLMPFTAPTLWLGVGLLTAVSLCSAYLTRTELAQFLRQHWRHLLLLEAIGVGLYLLQIGIRLLNPDAWHIIWGGEKPMDMAYFTAVLKSTHFPPYDPWLAGGYLNYYYYGFVFVGTLTKLLGIVPAMAYNLILPMLFSFTGLAVFSLAHGLVRHNQPREKEKLAWLAGGTAVVLAIIVGNLGEFRVFFQAWERASTLPPDSFYLWRLADGAINILGGTPAPIYPGDWFWTATRAIAADPGEVQPITEFPFFTFLYGDLHAHMMALPLTMLALGWAIALVLQSVPEKQSPLKAVWGTVGQWGTAVVALGVLYPTNSWDFPTYAVLYTLAILLWNWRLHGWTLVTLARALYQISLTVGLAIVAFYPFWANFGTGYNSISLWQGSTTSVGDFLVIYGLFLFILLTFLAHEFKAWAQSWALADLERYSWLMALLVVALLPLPLGLWWMHGRGYVIAPLVIPIILVAGVMAVWATSRTLPQRIVYALIASGLGLIMFVEIFVLDGDIGRMNTVFKFYLQVWLLFSISAGAAFAWLQPILQTHWQPTPRTVWQSFAVLLLSLALLYPIMATRAKAAVRMGDPSQQRTTLDSLAFMEYVTYDENGRTVPLNFDLEAIRWMQRNLAGSPVILEAHSGNPYRSVGNRIAMYTGLPAVVGWDWHQRQQRTTTPSSLVSNRISEVNLLYNTTDIPLATYLLDKYGVEYVYVGQLEWNYYTPEGLNKFDQMVAAGILEEVYRNRGTSIYRVK
jgi:YYY domain-containing protein